MYDNSRTRWSIGAQLNVWMALSMLVPAAATIGLGAWAIHSTGVGGALPPETTLWAVTFGITVFTVMAVAIFWFRMRGLVRGQALELADVCRQISSGDRAARAPVYGDDEFAVLAAAVNSVLDGAPVGGMAPSGGGDTQDAAALQGQIEKLLQEVSAVGDGDLRVQAEVTPDTLGVLADSFNYMIEELAKVVGRVQTTTFQVTNATRRLLDRSAEVASASEAQVSQIAETTNAVARLADFVQLSANNAQAAAEAAREALRNAEGGQHAVIQTIDGMVHIRENVQDTSKKIKRLGERSQEVGEIVRIIEDIADQTNLLALNAAIQSAMAGEHGRGFAVVADEIRLLAERVTESTKKIATIVKSIQGDTFEAVVAMEESTQEVVNGSRLADEAGEALRSINGAVDRQAKMIEGIAKAANERAQTAEIVSNAMSRIAEITRQTNVATQDASAAVSYLAELAEQLRASVATFRLPDQVTQGQSLLPQPEAAYAPMVNLPNLASPGWGNEMRQLPQLPPAPAGAVSAGQMPDSFDFNAFDGFYNDQQNNGLGYNDQQYNNQQYNNSQGYNGQGYGGQQYAEPQPAPAPVPQQGYNDQQFNQGPYGSPPFPDLY
ncbi:MAG TPA: methyl-accepting chemotaxis protein [Ktedonobacterales bacterium]|nr:methyl-accepting chemotaxis protein [Ktedonobacterales bacterium]